jgi:HSP20 family protein
MGFLDKWKSSKELDRFRDEMDDLLERFGVDRDWFGRFPFNRDLFTQGESIPARPAIDTRVENGKFIVHTDLPGVDPKNVEIKVVGDRLTVKGSREEKSETKKADFFKREIRYGSFERSIVLPEGIKADDLKATYHDGVLELTAPMPKEAAPKEVKIQIESPKGAIEKKNEAA